jgi:hypothetical protein
MIGSSTGSEPAFSCRRGVVATPLLCAFVVLFVASPARAQVHDGADRDIGSTVLTGRAAFQNLQIRPRQPVRPRREPIGVRAYAFSDATTMRATKTFDATVGTTTMTGLGAGVEVLRLWHKVFARAAFSTSSAVGERVIVFEGKPIPLGIPMHVRLSPIELGGGWREDLGRRRTVGVYAGASIIRMRFEQTSDFAQADDDVDETSGGFAAFGGVDYTIAKWLVVGAEGQFRTVPNALGQDGVSKALGEKELGGMTFRVMFGIRR